MIIMITYLRKHIAHVQIQRFEVTAPVNVYLMITTKTGID